MITEPFCTCEKTKHYEQKFEKMWLVHALSKIKILSVILLCLLK